MSYIPPEIISKIMLYNIHPVAEMFKSNFEPFTKTKEANNNDELWGSSYLFYKRENVLRKLQNEPLMNWFIDSDDDSDDE